MKWSTVNDRQSFSYESTTFSPPITIDHLKIVTQKLLCTRNFLKQYPKKKKKLS